MFQPQKWMCCRSQEQGQTYSMVCVRLRFERKQQRRLHETPWKYLVLHPINLDFTVHMMRDSNSVCRQQLSRYDSVSVKRTSSKVMTAQYCQQVSKSVDWVHHHLENTYGIMCYSSELLLLSLRCSLHVIVLSSSSLGRRDYSSISIFCLIFNASFLCNFLLQSPVLGVSRGYIHFTVLMAGNSK